MNPLESWTEEQRSAFLYRACADAESGTVRAELFRRLAGEAEAQAAIWRAQLTSRGHPAPGPFMPDARTHMSRDLLTEVMLPREDWLLARPFMISNWRKHSDYLEQYGRVHYPQDLLRFTAEAVDQQLLDRKEAVRFLGEELMLPGGIELGVFPADFWVRTVTAIESVVRACVKRWNVAREGYDARAWAFCVERLGSYLVLRELRTLPGFELRLFDLRWASPNHWSRRFGGRLNLLTDDADDYVIGA